MLGIASYGCTIRYKTTGYIVPERTKDILVDKTHLGILPILSPFLVCPVQEGGEEWEKSLHH